jgi:hypothetical protein
LGTWLAYKASAEAYKASTDVELDRFRDRLASMVAAQTLGVGHLRDLARERDLLDASNKHQISVVAELRKELKKRKSQTARAVKILLLE